MARILVTRHVTTGGLDPLIEAGHEVVQRSIDTPFTHAELVKAVPEFDGLICLLTDQIDEKVLAAGAAGSLRVVGTAAVGFDNIDVEAATRHQVVICNTPGVLDETTADVAFLLILSATRAASSAEARLRSGQWTGWGFTNDLATDVHGATLGLVGYGRIAKQVARRAEGFSMTVLHHARSDSGVPGYRARLEDLLAESDIVSVHVPLTAHTRHLIGATEFAQMKPGSVLVNTARGQVVDEDAMVDALESGQLFAAGLDVYEGEPNVSARVLGAPRTVLLPHIGSATVATRTAMAQMACDGVCAVLGGRVPPNALNHP
jgi:glyoxylate reductase